MASALDQRSTCRTIRFSGTEAMLYVYLIRSTSHPGKRYVGVTDNVRLRLDAHNHGESTFTAQFRPWELVTYIAFADHDRAFAFERYLKAGSGHAFANRHLW